jgi:O-antigen ligase
LFAFFSVLLFLALVTYGAVQAHIYLFVSIVWLVALAVFVVTGTLESHRLSFGTIGYIAISTIALVIDNKLALGVFAAGWGWFATRKFPLKTLSFLKLLILIGTLEALLGLVQYFVAPGWIFSYHNINAVSSGTFINRNHFAGFLEMIVPATIGFAFASIMRGRDTARGYFYLFLGAFISIAIVFSLSRMGIFCCLLTILFLGAALQLKSTRRGSTALILVVMGLIVAGTLWIGVDIILQRFADLSGEDALLEEGRLDVFANTLKMIAARPFGVGIGAYPDIFRQYQMFRPEFLFDHAHNDYLETAAEWGILPAVVFWVVIFIIFGRAFRSFVRTQSVERTTILLASMGAILSILLHSLTDFNLQIPSNAMLFFMFVGIAAQASSSQPFPSHVENEPAVRNVVRVD